MRRLFGDCTRALRDLWDDGLASVAARPGRTALTIGGTVLGIGSLVVTSGIAASASANVISGFDAYKATEVVLRDSTTPSADLDPSRLDALRGVKGVVHAGSWCDLTPSSPRLGSVAVTGNDAANLNTVIALDADTLAALRPHYASGRGFTDTQAIRVRAVAVVGIGVARTLHLPNSELRPTVTVNGVPFTVVGVVDDVRRRAVTLNAVLIPTPARALVRPGPCPSPLEVVSATKLGAAQVVGSVAARVADPSLPDRFSVEIPPDPRALRQSVEKGLGSLYIALAIISMLVGALSIGNTMTVAVMERRAEIGVRRALGFRRRSIAALFCSESVLVGAIGGLVGTAAGTLVVLGVSGVKGWTPTFQPVVLLAAPLIGAVTGLLGGAVPAVRASKVEPARAVRL